MAIPTITTKLPTIASEDFTKEKVLGKGAFGQVYLGHWQATPIAVKELLVQTISDTFIKTFRSEAQLMAQCQHPNTVRLFGVCLEKGKLALIMEYLEKGSLYGMLCDTEVPIAWTRRFSIAADTGRGLAYLHSQNILHRDLKSLNILIAKDDTAKITDFGFAKVRLESSSVTTGNQQGGTVRWTAPELFQPNSSATPASDVYSFGMVLWEIAARKVPFSHTAHDGLVMFWKSTNVHETIPPDCPKEYGAIIQKCWKPAIERPPAKTIAQELNQLQQNSKNLNLDQPVIAEMPSVATLDVGSTSPSLPISAPIDYLSNVLSNRFFIASPAPSIVNTIPSMAFGKALWEKHFGDVGIEPPLPSDINAILSASCPFWPEKKVQDTHLLVLVPQTVNGKPLTLKTLGELIQKPLQGPRTRYNLFLISSYTEYICSDDVYDEYTDPAAPKSHWALLTRDVVEGSQNKKYSEQQALIKGKAPYEVPTILDATVAILMEHVRTGTRLYSDRIYTRCQEKHSKDTELVVGDFRGAGLGLSIHGPYYYVNDKISIGVAGLRKFW